MLTVVAEIMALSLTMLSTLVAILDALRTLNVAAENHHIFRPTISSQLFVDPNNELVLHVTLLDPEESSVRAHTIYYSPLPICYCMWHLEKLTYIQYTSKLQLH